MKAYREDLAYIHDVGYGDFARDAAPGILKTLRDHGIASGRVVDLGCGSGLWARAIVDAGYSVVGIDQSNAMLDLARKRVPEGKFRRGSYLTSPIPECDAVTAMGEILSYLFDAKVNLNSLRSLFHRVYAALCPGGLFMFDVAEPGRGTGPRQNHRVGADWACLSDVEEEAGVSRLTRRIVAYRKVGRLYRRSEETHHLRLYKRAELASVMRDAGFQVRIIRSYGNRPFPKGLVGFVARKPG